jgi:hypothetical protein
MSSTITLPIVSPAAPEIRKALAKLHAHVEKVASETSLPPYTDKLVAKILSPIKATLVVLSTSFDAAESPDADDIVSHMEDGMQVMATVCNMPPVLAFNCPIRVLTAYVSDGQGGTVYTIVTHRTDESLLMAINSKMRCTAEDLG